MCCRQLSLTNPVVTTDSRNYPSRSFANFEHVENLVTAKQFVVIPFRFRWRPHGLRVPAALQRWSAMGYDF